MFVGTSAKGQRTCIKEPVDLSSGQSEDSYHDSLLRKKGLRQRLLIQGHLEEC